jgi:hypothetical protein
MEACMKRVRILTPLAAALALGAHAAPATAQTPDTAFAVRTGSTPLFRVYTTASLLGLGTINSAVFSTADSMPTTGAGARFMYIADRGALRAGSVNGTQWDGPNVGAYSVALGQDVRASADNAVAMGLRSTAAQISSVAIGEDNTASGAASVALGYHAHTNARQGSFVFSDRSSADSLRAGVNHSANWRVTGGFRIFTAWTTGTGATAGVTIQSGSVVSNWGQSNAVISTSTGAYLSTSGVWTNNSDVRRKHDFLDVSGEDVLGRLRTLPITTWSYRVDPGRIRHLGPMAQDFHAAFGLGNDDVTISTVDEGGVALAAAKALEARSRAQQARIDALEHENADLRARLERIEAALAAQRKP